MISKVRQEYLDDLVRELLGLTEQEARYVSDKLQEANLEEIDNLMRKINAEP